MIPWVKFSACGGVFYLGIDILDDLIVNSERYMQYVLKIFEE